MLRVNQSAVSSTVQSFFIYRIWYCAFKEFLGYLYSWIPLVMQSRLRWLFPVILMPFVVAQLGEFASLRISRPLKRKEH